MEKQWISTIELLNYLKEHPIRRKNADSVWAMA